MDLSGGKSSRRAIITVVAISSALLIAMPTAAFAAGKIGGGAVSCSNSVLVGSNAKGKVYHSHNGQWPAIDWNNSTYRSRVSGGPASIPGWYAQATGSGSNVAAAYPRCA